MEALEKPGCPTGVEYLSPARWLSLLTLTLTDSSDAAADATQNKALVQDAITKGIPRRRLAHSVSTQAVHSLLDTCLRGIRADELPDGTYEVFLDRDPSLSHECLSPCVQIMVHDELKAGGAAGRRFFRSLAWTRFPSAAKCLLELPGLALPL